MFKPPFQGRISLTSLYFTFSYRPTPTPFLLQMLSLLQTHSWDITYTCFTNPFLVLLFPAYFFWDLRNGLKTAPKLSQQKIHSSRAPVLWASLFRGLQKTLFSCLSILVIWFCCCGPAIPLGSLDAQGICAAGFHTEAQTQTQLRSVATSPYHPQLHWGLLIYIKTSFYKWYPLVALLVAPARPRIKRESAAVWSQGRPPHRSALSRSREEASGTYAWW